MTNPAAGAPILEGLKVVELSAFVAAPDRKSTRLNSSH